MPVDRLSQTFAALADPTRRAILDRLMSGPRSVGDLAAPFEISLPAVSRHLKVLERSGLIRRETSAQWRLCHLRPAPLHRAAGWLERYRVFWSGQLDALEQFLERNRPDPPIQVEMGRPTMTTAEAPASTEPSAETATLRLTRRFQASPEALFTAFTDSRRLVRWFGPKGMTVPDCRIDLREGGGWRACMRSPQGNEHCVGGVYREIRRPNRLVFTWIWEQGEMSGAETLVTLDFVAQGDGADFVLFGSFTRFGDGASLDLRCATVASPGEGDEAQDAARRLFIQSGALGEIIPQLDTLAQKVARYAIGTGAAPQVAGASDGKPAASSAPRGPSPAEYQALLQRIEALESALIPPVAEKAEEAGVVVR